jgi:hypothetical protein
MNLEAEEIKRGKTQDHIDWARGGYLNFPNAVFSACCML